MREVAELISTPERSFRIATDELHAVEGFFSALTRRRLRRGDFISLVDLQAAIKRYIAEHNNDPRPFVWTKPAKLILAKINRHAEPMNESVH